MPEEEAFCLLVRYMEAYGMRNMYMPVRGGCMARCIGVWSRVWWRVGYSRRLPALGWISSLWHSEHWAEITLRQHQLWPSQCFVLIKQSDSPCPFQFWVGCSLHWESNYHRGKNESNFVIKTPDRIHKLPVKESHIKRRYLKNSIRPPRPNPQSQSFSQSYGSILPTSLIYIVLSTRGCSPWRPDAVMSTTKCVNKSRLRIFKDRWERTEHTKDWYALPWHHPYRRVIRFQGQIHVKKKR